LICPDCGCQRDDDDTGECACALDGFGGQSSKPKPDNARARFPNSMRAMVARKLEKQRANANTNKE